jgi:hypothetical protein
LDPNCVNTSDVSNHILDRGEYIKWFYHLAYRLVLRRLSVPCASETLMKQHGVDAFMRLPRWFNHFVGNTESPRFTLSQLTLVRYDVRWHCLHSETLHNVVLTRYCVVVHPKSWRKWSRRRDTRPNMCLILMISDRHPLLTRFTFGHR